MHIATRRTAVKFSLFSEVSNCGLGKLSQTDVKKSVKYVNSWLQLSAIKYSPDMDLLEVNPLSENMAEAVFTRKEDRSGYHRNTQGDISFTF